MIEAMRLWAQHCDLHTATTPTRMSSVDVPDSSWDGCSMLGSSANEIIFGA